MPRQIDEEDEAYQRPFDQKQFIRLLRYLIPHRIRVAYVIVLVIVAGFVNQATPYLMKIGIDTYIKSMDLRGLNLLAGLLLACNITGWIAAYLRTYLMAYIGQNVLYTMRQELFTHIQWLSFRFYDSRPAGKIIARITGDVGTLNDLITNGIINIVADSVNLIIIVIALLSMHVKLALLSFCILPFMAIWALRLRPRIRLLWRMVRARISAINANLNESILGMKVTQAFVREDRNLENFRDLLKKNLDTWMKAISLNVIFGPVVEVIGTIGTCVVIWYGVREIASGRMTVGMIMAFLSYLGRFWAPVSTLTNFYGQVQAAMASSERVFEFLDTRPEIEEKPGAVALPPIKGAVNFEHVSFGYEPGQVVLKDFSLSVRPGETIALVGPTGAGKTSIVNLLNRFYDPTEGRITIDGYDIRDVTLKSLRSQIGIVLQDTVLFSGSIEDNIRYGKLDASMEEIEEAARIANIHDFIMQLPQGYKTEIEERGSKLSVGQRQLLSLARAVLANPRILILDEATSNIDARTEMLLQEAIERVLKGRTSFVIAHRLSTIRNANRIVVIENGRIAQMGTHEELINTPGIYRDLSLSQVREQSLAV